MSENKSLIKVQEVFDGKIVGIDETHYQALVEDLKDIIVEGIHHSRIEMVHAKWLIGQRIVAEFHETKPLEYKVIIDRLGKDLKTSVSELYRCTEFFNKYLLEFKCKTFENILELLPEGKNISWNKIKLLYLPDVPSAKIPYIIPQISMDDDDFKLMKWWSQNEDKNFTLILADKKYDFKLQVKLVRNPKLKTTPLKELFEEIGALYIKLKKWNIKDVDGSDYGRMNKSIKRLLIKARGDKIKVIKAINWVAGQEYIDWSLETVEKKYADAVRPVAEYEKYLKKGVKGGYQR
jgi:hypothetical protein